MTTHTLTFSNIVGNFTADKEILGNQDPYVVFSTGGEKTQTKAIKNVGTGTAEWKETYTLANFAPKQSTHIEVEVYNHNTLRPNNLIGSGRYDLSSIGESQGGSSGHPITVPLTDKKSKNVGTLQFSVNGGGYVGHRGTTGTGSTQTGQNVTGTGGSAGVARSVGSNQASIGNKDHHAHTGTATGVGAGTGQVHGGQHVSTGQQGHVQGTAPGQVVDRQYYTGTEDRPQQQALVENVREHNPYAVDYETTVQHTGRERLVDTNIDVGGTTEKVVGANNVVHGNPHHEIAHNLPAGAKSARPDGEGWVQGKPGPICDSHNFHVTGDRTVDKERVTDLKEHRNFEKEFEVKTQVKGERELQHGVTTPDMLNRERVLIDEKSKNACAGHPDIPSRKGADRLG